MQSLLACCEISLPCLSLLSLVEYLRVRAVWKRCDAVCRDTIQLLDRQAGNAMLLSLLLAVCVCVGVSEESCGSKPSVLVLSCLVTPLLFALPQLAMRHFAVTQKKQTQKIVSQRGRRAVDQILILKYMFENEASLSVACLRCYIPLS